MAIKSILAALDGSPASQSALRHAFDLARSLGAGVAGLFVKDELLLEAYLLRDFAGMVGAQPITELNSRMDALLDGQAEALFSGAAQQASSAGVEFRGRVESGRVGSVLAAKASKSGLAALGIRGAGSSSQSRRSGVGSHLIAVLSGSRVPVLAAPEDYQKIKGVTAAYDGSPHSRRALKLAATVARAAKLPLRLVSVDEDGAGKRLLAEAKKLAGMDAKLELRKGQGRPGLARLAREKGFLLAMGTHGHGYFHEMVVGSTTQAVLNTARVPVLLSR